MKIMKTSELIKLLIDHTPNEILTMYMNDKVNLTDRQIERLIGLKKGTPEENRGGVNTNG